MFSLFAPVRNLRALALAAVLALVASLSLVALGTPPAEAAFKPTLTVTPTGTNTVRVEGKFPHKSDGKVTALYVMTCANPGKNRPSSTYCVSDWKGSKSADKFAYPSKKAANAAGLKSTAAGTIKVTVKTTAVAAPTGTVKVTVAGKSVSKSLAAAAKGTVSLKLPKLKKGKHKVKVTYTPTGPAKHASKAATKTITMTVK